MSKTSKSMSCWKVEFFVPCIFCNYSGIKLLGVRGWFWGFTMLCDNVEYEVIFDKKSPNSLTVLKPKSLNQI